MLKSFFSLTITFILLTSQVFAGSTDGLKKAYDEMNYSLTVEWDQKNEAFYEAQIKKFNNTIRDLKAEGLTNSELLAFAKNHIQDSKLSSIIEKAFLMININKMSPEDSTKYIMDTLKKSYSNGASWNGLETWMPNLFIAAFVAFAIAMTTYNPSNGNELEVSCLSSVGNCYYFQYECGSNEAGPIFCEETNCICNELR